VENQTREKQQEKVIKFPIVLFILVITICIVLPQIIIQGIKLTKFKQLTGHKFIIVYAVVMILTIIPFFFILFKGQVTYRYSDKCIESQYKTQNSLLTNSNLCNLSNCV